MYRTTGLLCEVLDLVPIRRVWIGPLPFIPVPPASARHDARTPPLARQGLQSVRALGPGYARTLMMATVDESGRPAACARAGIALRRPEDLEALVVHVCRRRCRVHWPRRSGSRSNIFLVRHSRNSSVNRRSVACGTGSSAPTLQSKYACNLRAPPNFGVAAKAEDGARDRK